MHRTGSQMDRVYDRVYRVRYTSRAMFHLIFLYFISTTWQNQGGEDLYLDYCILSWPIIFTRDVEGEKGSSSFARRVCFFVSILIEAKNTEAWIRVILVFPRYNLHKSTFLFKVSLFVILRVTLKSQIDSKFNNFQFPVSKAVSKNRRDKRDGENKIKFSLSPSFSLSSPETGRNFSRVTRGSPPLIGFFRGGKMLAT